MCLTFPQNTHVVTHWKQSYHGNTGLSIRSNMSSVSRPRTPGHVYHYSSLFYCFIFVDNVYNANISFPTETGVLCATWAPSIGPLQTWGVRPTYGHQSAVSCILSPSRRRLIFFALLKYMKKFAVVGKSANSADCIVTRASTFNIKWFCDHVGIRCRVNLSSSPRFCGFASLIAAS